MNLLTTLIIKLKKKKDNYDFLTLIKFEKNPITIKLINYSKEKNKKSNLKLKGSYNKNKVKLNEIRKSHFSLCLYPERIK